MAEDIGAVGLDGIGSLSVVSAEVRAEMARCCRWRRYRGQEQVIDRQSETRDVWFIVQGAVRIVIYSLSGRELTLDDLTAGQFFGELSAIDGHPRSASAMSLTDTVMAAMPAEQFVRFLRDYPAFAMMVMQRLASVIRSSTGRIIDLSTLGANNRVHAELLRQAREARPRSDGTVVLKPIPVHSDIASRVSTTRETVARVLNDLARHSIVRRERDALVIVDVAQLEEMVEQVRGE